VGVGIRAIDAEEKALIDELGLTMVYGEELETVGWVERVMAALGENVYISFDVDFFDPAFVP
ncbi:MAG: agmatinase, partial [Gemmatimonadetes bacterium]|nr:agmatinase [Gemmatimonadota bacterium]NIS02857.1 agmatinase [Gemmatimonadota bacterium]NIT66272.1 agmatinase [Gemmatimonadota bacterium]NIW38237.1 agmatinase [Gemmatimonadota bacterium]NIW74701.1 agmatinase [Gemmatimonadota bacterium]